MAYDVQMALRLESIHKLKFEKICNKANRAPSDLLREFVIAFNEGRLTIRRKAGDELDLDIYTD